MRSVRCFIRNGKTYIKLTKELTPSTTALATINNNNNIVQKQNRMIAAVDSAASDHYFPATYQGEAPTLDAPKYVVGTASRTSMKSVVADRFPLKEMWLRRHGDVKNS